MEDRNTMNTGAYSFSEADRQEAWQMYQQGMGVRAIARHFGRAPSTISRFLSHERARIETGAPAARPLTFPRRSPRAGGSQARGARTTITPRRIQKLEERLAKIEALLGQLAVTLRPASPRGRKR